MICLTDAEVADSLVDISERNIKNQTRPPGYAISRLQHAINPIYHLETQPPGTNRKQCVPITTSEGTPQTPTLRGHKHKHKHAQTKHPDTQLNSRLLRHAMCLNYTHLQLLGQFRASNPYTLRQLRKQLSFHCLVVEQQQQQQQQIDNGRR